MENHNQSQKEVTMGRDELSREGQELWDMIGQNEKTAVKSKTSRRNRSVNEKVLDSDFLRLQMMILLENSNQVIKDCEVLIEEYTKKEKYFCANEAKTASLIHRNFRDRLQRVLNGEAAFDYEVDLPEDYSLMNDKDFILIK